MAPPPITTAVPGTSGMDSTSSEVMTTVPSTSNPGIVRGSEPAAMITASPVTVTCSPPSLGSIVTVRPGCRRPGPRTPSTLRPLAGPEPPTSSSTTFCLRCCVTDEVDAGRAGVDAELAAARTRCGRRGRSRAAPWRGCTPREAGAAEPALLDQCDVEPCARAVERRRVAAGAATDDDDVEVSGREEMTSREVSKPWGRFRLRLYRPARPRRSGPLRVPGSVAPSHTVRGRGPPGG